MVGNMEDELQNTIVRLQYLVTIGAMELPPVVRLAISEVATQAAWEVEAHKAMRAKVEGRHYVPTEVPNKELYND